MPPRRNSAVPKRSTASSAFLLLSAPCEAFTVLLMKISSLVVFSVLAAAMTLFVGCNTFDRRAEEKAGIFNSLDEGTKARLKEGNIHIGDTPDMVYIALGIPDAKRQRVTAGTRELIWVYKTYYQDYQGSQLVGYRRYFVPVAPNRYVVHFEPIRREIYDERSEENMRITFVDGSVSTVEQVQR